MVYRIFKPSESLKDFIRFYWVFETNASEFTPLIHPATAAGSAKLAFHYKGRFEIETRSSNRRQLFTSGFQGPAGKSEVFIGKESIGVFGVYFSPYALPALFSVPADELSNQNVEIESLLGKQGEELEDKMMSAESNTERLNIINTYFENRLNSLSSRRTAIEQSVHQVITNKGLINVNELSEELSVSKRQFERKFKSVTGFSPKLFSRIIRFENALTKMEACDTKLTEVAFECGFYDQSHFIRDFKEFAGQHPSAYLTNDLSVFSQG